MPTRRSLNRTWRPVRIAACESFAIVTLLLILSWTARAQVYNWITNNGTITITWYNYIFPGAAVIPSTINGLPVTGIGDSAFQSCSGLTSITLPDTLTSIGNSAFYGCSGLTSLWIPNSVTNIGQEAFIRCSGLTSITLGSGLTHLGERPFAGCSSLASITVAPLCPAYQGVNGVLLTKDGTFLIQCPPRQTGSYTIPANVARIGEGAFPCAGLTNVMMGNSVASIEARAFSGCGLASVSLPDTLTNMGQGAFEFCPNLRSLGMGNGLKSIEPGAFFACASLTNVTIPETVQNIGSNAFASCTALTGLTIGRSVTNIGQRAFYRCPNLPMVIIPDNVSTVGDSVFDSCDALAQVTMGSGLRSIGANAFWGCALTSLSLPASVTSIGDGAFLACARLAAITVEPQNPVYSSLDGVLFDKQMTSLIQCPGGKRGSWTIPNGVTSIGTNAFSSCSLTSVTIASGITSIPRGAFEYSSSLVSVIIPDSVRSIGEFAFAVCTGLTTMTIPNSVTNIGAGAFESCSSLPGIVIPESVTRVGDGAFTKCASLTNVRIGNGLTELADSTFYSCTSLTNVAIPDGIKRIGAGAFGNCSGLSTVVVGAGVTNIGCSAFSGCTKLLTAYFKGNAPILDCAYVFYNDVNLTLVRLPAASGWYWGFGGRPVTMWPAPVIEVPPQTQTAEVGSTVEFRVRMSAIGDLPTGCRWSVEGSALLDGADGVLQLAGIQMSQAGAYTVVVTNAAGSATSAPAILNVIPAVERRMVPGLNLTGRTGSTLNLDFSSGLGSGAQWTTFDSIPLGQSSQWYFDVAEPLPPRKFYRAWQAASEQTPPTLDLHMVPALMLNGAIGDSLRVEYINQLGPQTPGGPLP